MASNWDYVLKVVIIGDEAVGKSSLLARMADQQFLAKYDPTVSLVSLISVDTGRPQWEVSPEEAERFAQAEGLSFIEASAKTGENVGRVFEEVTHDIMHKVKRGIFEDNNSTRLRSDPNTLALEKPTSGMLDKLKRSIFDVMSTGTIEPSSGGQLQPSAVTGIAHRPIVSSLLSSSDIITLLGERGCENLTSRLDPLVCSTYPVSTGGFGDVFSGRLRNGTPVAIKAMRSCELDGITAGKYQKRAAKELYAWSKCRHPNVARLLGLAMFQGRLAMISEWATNGTLPAFLRKYPDANRCFLSTGICEGLAYLHENKIVYGDLKGANVLVTEVGIPMLTDFGNASLAESTVNFTATTSFSFSLRWTAPEILKESSQVSYAGDVYALGMTILETITGEVPFSEVKDRTIYTTVVYKKKTPPRPEAQIPIRSICGNLLWSLLLSCWARQPQLRPSAVDVRDFMKPLTPEKLVCIEAESSSEDDS